MSTAHPVVARSRLQVGSFDRLPGTQKESKEIPPLFAGGTNQVFVAHGRLEVEGWKTHLQVLNTCAQEDRRCTWSQGIRPLRGARDLQRSPYTLHARREDADYEIGRITTSGAQEALRFAREFIRRVEERIRERESQTRG